MKNITKILPDLLVCGGAVCIVVGLTIVSAEGVISAIGGDSA